MLLKLLKLLKSNWQWYIEGILPKGPTRHAYAWQIGPFRQDSIDIGSGIGLAANRWHVIHWADEG